MLDDAPFLHDHDTVRDLCHDAEVVGDEHHAHPLATLNVPDQLQDLRLRGDVECCRRFVGDQDSRLERQGHGDHHALALAA